MSQDEVFVLIVSGGAAVVTAYFWFWRLATSLQAPRAKAEFAGLAAMPFVAGFVVWFVIIKGASYDVREAPQYILLYCALGAAWFVAATFLLRYLGISFRDDAVERRNAAAALVLSAVMLAHAAIYAGANIGDGPGWWTVVFAAGLGSVTWFLLWAALEVICGVSERITVDRDFSAAVRLAGYALAAGVICARGSAGDWTSPAHTVIEFAAALPVAGLAIVAIAVEKFWGGRGLERNAVLSFLIATAYLAFAVLAVQLAGPLPQNPLYDAAGVTP